MCEIKYFVETNKEYSTESMYCVLAYIDNYCKTCHNMEAEIL